VRLLRLVLDEVLEANDKPLLSLVIGGGGVREWRQRREDEAVVA
jgi:hypothetical protein